MWGDVGLKCGECSEVQENLIPATKEVEFCFINNIFSCKIYIELHDISWQIFKTIDWESSKKAFMDIFYAEFDVWVDVLLSFPSQKKFNLENS